LAANNIDSFIQALNAANNITTFGWWDSVEQQPVGYIITWAAGGPPQYEAVNGAPAATGTALAKDKVYQLALNNALSFNIKGTR